MVIYTWNRQRWIVAVGQVILQVFLKPSLQSETAVTSGAIRKSNAKYAVVVSLRVYVPAKNLICRARNQDNNFMAYRDTINEYNMVMFFHSEW